MAARFLIGGQALLGNMNPTKKCPNSLADL